MGAPFSLPREILDAARKEREESALSTWAKPIDDMISTGMNGLRSVAKGAAEQLSPFAQALAEGGLKTPTLDDLSTPTNDAAMQARTTWMQTQQPQPTPSGTPSAMPGQRQTVDATITTGPRVTGDAPQPGDRIESVNFGPASGPPSDGVLRWAPLVDEASRQYGVPREIILGLMEIESGGNPGARSVQGAMGLMQVMPFHYGPGEDGMDPRTSVMRGAKILADNYRRWGTWDQAAAAYFGAIDDQGRITDATDATGTTGSKYVALYRSAASKYAQPQASVPRSPEMQTQPNTPAVTQGQTLAPIGVAPRNEPVEYQRQPDQRPLAPNDTMAPPDRSVGMPGLPPGAPPLDTHWPDPVLRRSPNGVYIWTDRVQSQDAPQYPIVYDPRQSSMSSNAAAPSPVAASLPSAGPAGVPPTTSGAGLPPSVRERWRQQFGREPTPEEASELMTEMARFLA